MVNAYYIEGEFLTGPPKKSKYQIPLHIWALQGTKKCPKWAKMGIFTIKAICDHLFIGTLLE